MTKSTKGPLGDPMRRQARIVQLMLDAIGLNGEMCVGIGKRIKAQHEGMPLMVMAPAPASGNFSTPEELVQLGYEVKEPYSPEAEDFLISKVMEMTTKMK